MSSQTSIVTIFRQPTWRALVSRRPYHYYYAFSQTKIKDVSRSRTGSAFKYRMYRHILPSSPISTDSLSLSTANCAIRNSVRTCGVSWGCADPISQFYGHTRMDNEQAVDTPFRSFRIYRSLSLGWDSYFLSLQPRCRLIALFWLVLTVNYVIQHGKSNWLEGMILMCAYSPSSLQTAWLINTLYSPLCNNSNHILLLSSIKSCRRSRDLQMIS